jgi:uncharacterized protein (TIGR03435 family)
MSADFTFPEVSFSIAASARDITCRQCLQMISFRAMRTLLPAFLACLLIGMPLITKGQFPNAVSFEVVSIKQNKSGRREMRINPSGGRLTATNVSVKVLIASAFDLSEWQISGAPGWTESDRFDIEARADREVSATEMFHMLQGVLAGRFKLVSHRESRNVTGYTILLAGTASKLKPAAGDGPPREMTSPVDGRPSAMQMSANNMTMSDVADSLGNMLQAPVADHTGLTGSFDFAFTLDDAPAGMTPELMPSIFTALREQVGLKMESAKVPVQFLVIDRVERPSEN